MLRAILFAFLLAIGHPVGARGQEDTQVNVSAEATKAAAEGDYATARRLVDAELKACAALSPNERKCILLLTFHIGVATGQPDLGQRVVRAITAAEDNFGPGSLAAAIVLGAAARALMHGKPGLAEKMYERAILIRTTIFGATDEEVLELRELLPYSLAMQGKIKEAVTAAETLLADARDMRDLKPVRLARLKISMVRILGPYDNDRAVALASEAIVALASELPPTDSGLLDAQFVLADVQPKVSVGRAIAEKALADAREARLSPGKLASYLLQTARLARRDSSYRQALAHTEQAEVILKSRPELKMFYVQVFKERMIVYAALKQYDLALSFARQMEAVAAELTGDDSFFTQGNRIFVINIHQHRGEYREVDRMFDTRTVRFWQQVPPSDPIRAYAFTMLGEAKLKLGDLVAARTWLRYAGSAALDVTAARKAFDTKAQSDMRDQGPLFDTQVQVAWRLAQRKP